METTALVPNPNLPTWLLADALESDRMLLVRSLNLLTNVVGRPHSFDPEFAEAAGDLWGALHRRLNH